MKSLSRMGILLLLVSAIACSKKEDPAPSIVGTWKSSTEIKSNCTDPNDNGTQTCTTDCFTITFTASTFTLTIPGLGGLNGNYTTSGSTLTLTVSGGSPTSGTYALTATTLTLTTTDSSSGCTVVDTLIRQ